MTKITDIDRELETITSFSTPVCESWTWQACYAAVRHLVLNNIPVLLAGPPGTGKTRLITELRKDLSASGDLGRFELVQFHKRFSYEDFIEGFEPTENGGFKKRDGVFKAFCKDSSSKRVDLFVIDEINRAELATTFGETLFLLEDRADRTTVTAHFGDKIRIPMNTSIVGTMNTADRNIALVDYALRRRFRVISCYPDKMALREWLGKIGFGFSDFNVDDYVRFFEVLNFRISKSPLMGRHMQLGQSMFVPAGTSRPIDAQDLVANFEQVLLSQLEAYCGFGNEQELGRLVGTLAAEKFLRQQPLELRDLVATVTALKNERIESIQNS